MSMLKDRGIIYYIVYILYNTLFKQSFKYLDYGQANLE